METSTSQISSSLRALTSEFEKITNNLANASTVGFKRNCNSFTQSLKEKMGEQIDVTTSYDFSQGNMVETGNKLDLALRGKGFFVIETPDGPLYTRNGSLRINKNGQVVDLDGRLVAGKDGPLVLPQDMPVSSINVSADGFMKAGSNTMGQLKLVEFGKDESQLMSVGKNCWAVPKTVRPAEAKATSVEQGYQEASNVVLVDEMVDMITVSRMYQTNMKLLTTNSDNSKSILNVAMG